MQILYIDGPQMMFESTMDPNGWVFKMVDDSAIRLPRVTSMADPEHWQPEMIEGKSVENYRRLLRRLRSNLNRSCQTGLA